MNLKAAYMKTINLTSIQLILFLITGCSSNESKIKKDLDSRFTKSEIVEIRKDSANVKTAIYQLKSLALYTTIINSEISKGLHRIETSYSSDKGNKTSYQIYFYIDSLQKSLFELLTEFEKSETNKVDPCYYVRFLVHKDENILIKEEYYFIHEENGDIIRRPHSWDEFLN